MTLFEKIEYMARLGKDSIVERPEGLKVLISHWRDGDGNLRNTYPLTKFDFKNAAMVYACWAGTPKHIWDKREAEGWKFVGEYARPEFERFKVSDKVKVIGEDHVCSIAYVDDNMIYGVNQVIAYFHDRPVWRLSNKEFHHDQLTPVFDEEPAEEPEKQEEQEQKTITIDGVEYYLTPKG